MFAHPGTTNITMIKMIIVVPFLIMNYLLSVEIFEGCWAYRR